MNDLEYLKKYLDKSKLSDGIKRLENNEPVQYIVGNVSFYGYTINVCKDVLIPRFETELLVEKTISYIKKYFDKKIDILDIGTGSGCIAIALKKEIDCNMDAVDISSKALKQASLNADLNDVDINFTCSDIFSNVEKKYDLIISNPPYIGKEEEIMDIVSNNEPHIALYAEDNGYYYYKKIIKDSINYLNDKSIIAFEIGETQGNYLIDYAKKYYKDSIVKVEKDLSGRDRFLFIINI